MKEKEEKLVNLSYILKGKSNIMSLPFIIRQKNLSKKD